MPPSYESESFWNTRFKTESHFEWLGDGRETIIPVLQQYLLTHSKAAKIPPKTLHIGAGTSTLSSAILKTYHDTYEGQTQTEMRDVVVNTDFAEEVVERGRESAEAGRDEVRWEKVDLLSWEDCRGLISEGGELFEVVVDKSTSDAISCGQDVSFSETLTGDHETSSTHPLIAQVLSRSQSEVPVVLEPLEVVALHLASLVKPRGMWIALSYSERRFPFLSASNKDSRQEVDVGGGRGGRDERDERGSTALDVSLFWELERVEKVDAPSGGNAHAPLIQHHLYILRRTDKTIE
ncbi:hypothetical protein BC629DRAFT_1289374 [Irpex lacteus]|nr:hypothetical protein BC629DRAFT_1289374 [Irpex lacteus]